MYVGDIFIAKENYALVGVGFTFTVAAVLIVTLRIFTRLYVVKNVGIDDGFIILSALGTVGFLIACMEQARFGLGTVVDLKTLPNFIQATVASVISYTVTHLAVKLSISFQYLRIFITQTQRRLFLSIIAFLAIYGIVCLLLTIITCWPVAKYWDDSIPGKCLDSRILRYAFAGINIVNDLVLLIVPLPFLKSLQLPRRAKLVLVGVFLCGGAACIIAVIRLHSLWKYSSVPIPQRQVVGVDIAIWSSLECNIAIMCACVPALNPLLGRLFPRLIGSYLHSPKRPHDQRRVDGSPHNYDSMENNLQNKPDHFQNHGRAKRAQAFEMTVNVANDHHESEEDLVVGEGSSHDKGTTTKR